MHPQPSLTTRQAQVLHFIATYFLRERQYPTNREICEGCGIRSSNPTPFIEPLVKKGLLVKLRGQRRNLRITERALPVLENLGTSLSPQSFLPLFPHDTEPASEARPDNQHQGGLLYDG